MAAKADPHRFDDLFSAFGPVTLRRLFSGEGIYADRQIIGLVSQDHIFLKTDETSRADYRAESCKPFYFRKDGKNSYAVPDRLYDADEFAQWARWRWPLVAQSRKRKSANSYQSLTRFSGGR